MGEQSTDTKERDSRGREWPKHHLGFVRLFSTSDHVRLTHREEPKDRPCDGQKDGTLPAAKRIQRAR
jgi:hypothetical protein